MPRQSKPRWLKKPSSSAARTVRATCRGSRRSGAQLPSRSAGKVLPAGRGRAMIWPSAKRGMLIPARSESVSASSSSSNWLAASPGDAASSRTNASKPTLPDIVAPSSQGIIPSGSESRSAVTATGSMCMLNSPVAPLPGRSPNPLSSTTAAPVVTVASSSQNLRSRQLHPPATFSRPLSFSMGVAARLFQESLPSVSEPSPSSSAPSRLPSTLSVPFIVPPMGSERVQLSVPQPGRRAPSRIGGGQCSARVSREK